MNNDRHLNLFRVTVAASVLGRGAPCSAAPTRRRPKSRPSRLLASAGLATHR